MFEAEADGICERANEIYLRNLGAFVSGHVDDEGESQLELLDLFKTRVSTARELFSRCESPIEEIMAAILPFVCTGYGYPSDDCGINPKFGAVIRPQHEVGGYRVDFLITFYCEGYERHIAIECDGHDFHERTKDQAARDKGRDRALSAFGLRLLRFTGSEIYRNALRIGDELESIFFDAIEDTMADAGITRRRQPKVAPSHIPADAPA